MADFLDIGVTGLRAFQRSLATTSHNIANVNTEGYSRQRVELSARPPQYVGGTYVGSGVQMDGVRRVYDQFLTDQVRTTSSAQQRHEALHELAAQIDDMLGDPEAGMAPVLQSFFNAAHDVADDPTSTPARQVLLSEAESLTARFHNVYDRLDDLRGAVNTRLDTMVEEVNTLASAIAGVNQDILNLPKDSMNGTANDLLDHRDRLITQLSEYVSLRTQDQSDSTVNVFIGNGQPLVVGTDSQALATTADPYDPTQLRIAFTGGGTAVDVTNQLSGGRLGGTLEFREQVLDGAFNGLGKVATGVAELFNAQHRLGQDLDGDLGADFFSFRAPEVLVHSSNSGTASISASITDVAQITTSDYRLERSGADYSLTRLSDGTVFDLDASGFPGVPVTVDGVEITLDAGAVADGDRFLLRPTRSGADSIGVSLVNTNDIAAAAPIRTSKSAVNTGSGQISAGTVDSLDANLTQTVAITFNNPPTTFDVNGTGTGNPSGVAYTSGSDISYNGWTIQISGAPAAGDTFTVAENTGGVGDNRNALEFAEIQNKPLLDNQTSTITDAYGSVVADVGSRTRQAQQADAAQSTLLAQSQAARESVSGVNLDEEAANLVRFQQAYQATAQVISSANLLFDTLLAAVRR